jgi:hypothetical protein
MLLGYVHKAGVQTHNGPSGLPLLIDEVFKPRFFLGARVDHDYSHIIGEEPLEFAEALHARQRRESI